VAGLESPWHIAILAIVLLVVFGSKRLPEIGRSMGTGMREFKRSISAHDDEPPTRTPTISPSETSVAAKDDAARRDPDTIV
jgi:sec-independent protein translocase protein TatA